MFRRPCFISVAVTVVAAIVGIVVVVVFSLSLSAVSGWCRIMGRRSKLHRHYYDTTTTKLHRHYYDPKRVGTYGGVAALERVVPAERNVERWLSTQDAYTLQKPVRRHFKRCCVVVGGPNQQWQADLVNMSSLKAANAGTTFLLTVIDVFSKRAWCVPLKSKSAASLVAAFRQLLNGSNSNNNNKNNKNNNNKTTTTTTTGRLRCKPIRVLSF